ncbi:hypothetical protein SAMN04489806_1724 [Paramicrobacterium humi]|uniref:Uncharacterized protein n=1 Tax=Paramicrobacterium humi TaxID=640635 RepID=A0A1H4M0Y9_9MICO|nr:hypothetical protein [Microbacterium humi]SEB76709.1 hypothetical protein SAMN04489806_1724 [Microbacterium humi]
MTNMQQPPEPGHHQNPTYGPMYGGPGYPPFAGSAPQGMPAPYSPRPPRPPLSGRQRTASLVAGGIGYPLLTAGFWILSVTLGLLVLGSVISAVAAQIERADRGSTGGFERVLAGLWAGGIWLLIVAALIGALLWLVGFFVSYLILRLSGVNRPAGTTWAGLGVGIVASFVISGVLWIVMTAFAWMFGVRGDGVGWRESGAAYGALWLGIAVIATVAVGAFSWWWMAHSLRARAVR